MAIFIYVSNSDKSCITSIFCFICIAISKVGYFSQSYCYITKHILQKRYFSLSVCLAIVLPVSANVNSKSR